MDEYRILNLYSILEARTNASITALETQTVLDRLRAGNLPPEDAKVIIERLQAILSKCDYLRREPWKGSANPLAGHCYVASEALSHLLKAQGKSGWVAQVAQVHGGPHWWLRHKETGEVLDPTASQFEGPVPYETGKNIGFLTKDPSKRALHVLNKYFKRG